MTLLDALRNIAHYRSRMTSTPDQWEVAAEGFEPVTMTYDQISALEELADIAQSIAEQGA